MTSIGAGVSDWSNSPSMPEKERFRTPPGRNIPVPLLGIALAGVTVCVRMKPFRTIDATPCCAISSLKSTSPLGGVTCWVDVSGVLRAFAVVNDAVTCPMTWVLFGSVPMSWIVAMSSSSTPSLVTSLTMTWPGP